MFVVSKVGEDMVDEFEFDDTFFICVVFVCGFGFEFFDYVAASVVLLKIFYVVDDEVNVLSVKTQAGNLCARNLVHTSGGTFVPRCGCGGAFKPDITFFGEALPEEAFARSQELAIRADVLLVLGTSLTVYPAAGLPRLTLQRGGKVFIVNSQPTPLDEYAAGTYPDLAAFAEAVLAI